MPTSHYHPAHPTHALSSRDASRITSRDASRASSSRPSLHDASCGSLYRKSTHTVVNGRHPKSLPDRQRIPRGPDGGYGWVVVAASFLLQTISGGIAFSVGVYFVEFLDAFSSRKGETAWIGSINTGLLFGAGPLASVLANRFGHRAVVMVGALLSSVGLFASAYATDVYTLYFTYGVLAGLGFCFIYVPAVVVVGIYFNRRRNLAMGLAAAGFACGNFILAPILRVFILYYGWRGALILSSGFCLNCLVLGALLFPVTLWNSSWEEVRSDQSTKLASILNVSLIKDPKFVIFLINNVLWNIGSLILLVICGDYALTLGINRDKAAALISCVGLCSLVGRVTVAVFGSHPRCNRFVLFIVSTAISGVAIAFYPIHPSFVSLMICSAIYGIFFGSQVGVLAVVTAELFGIERLTSAYGYLMFGNGAGAMIGPPIAGWVFDATHSYSLSFILGGGITILSSIILICIPVLAAREKQSHTLPTKYLASNGNIVISRESLGVNVTICASDHPRTSI